MFAADKPINAFTSRRKRLIAGCSLALLFWASYAYFNGTIEVSTAKATRGAISVTVDEIGYVQADDEYDVLAPASGYVSHLAVERGQMVNMAQSIMLLDSPEIDSVLETSNAAANSVAASINEARSNWQIAQHELADAEKKLAQKKTLLAVGAISQQEFDDAKLVLDRLRSRALSTGEIIANLESQLAALRRQQQSADRKVNQLVVKSPAAGTIIYLLPKAGEYVAQGTVVAKIGKSGRTRVNVDVLSDNMGAVALGQMVTVTSPVLTLPVTGTISTIYPQAFEKTSSLGVIQRRVRVIADLSEWGNLRSGYEVKVSITTRAKKDALLIPREALVMNPQGQYEVWRVSGERAECRKVTVGLKNRLHAEILAGLEPQDVVITASKSVISENTRVRSSN